jgi:hypothetical protein
MNREALCMLCGLQVGALGVIEILYDFLFLLETVGPETPPSNLSYRFKVAVVTQWRQKCSLNGIAAGACVTQTRQSPLAGEDRGKFDLSTTIEFHVKSHLLMTYVDRIG